MNVNYEISDVSIVPVSKSDGPATFYCSCTVNGELLLRGIKVYQINDSFFDFNYPEGKDGTPYFFPTDNFQMTIKRKLIQAIKESRFYKCQSPLA